LLQLPHICTGDAEHVDDSRTGALSTKRDAARRFEPEE